MVRQLTGAEYDSFIKQKTGAAIHFDAEWDVGYRPITRKRMLEAEATLSGKASFGEVDVDQEMDLARSLPLLNVPAVAYYCDGKLIAILPGVSQNVRERLERVLQGRQIGFNDGLDGLKPWNANLNILEKLRSGIIRI